MFCHSKNGHKYWKELFKTMGFTAEAIDGFPSRKKRKGQVKVKNLVKLTLSPLNQGCFHTDPVQYYVLLPIQEK